jgi:UDP-3-O-[3-hydroxymyristoyl] N-acetylglucosamine deacetylase
MSSRLQRTVKKKVTLSGIGLHTGCEVTMHFVPAPVDTGVQFQRIDLPHSPMIPATVNYVQDTSRSTTIGIGDSSVQTVEHVLAAVKASGIDNLYIQVTSGEPPIMDGSALPFLILLEEAGIEEQESIKSCYKLSQPVYFSEGKSHLVALPSEEFRVSYTLHYPHSKMIGSQYFSFLFSREKFKEEIASCRTFALYEEISFLKERGLIKGGSLENGVVIKDDVILSKEGLRYKDEMVRHKILDLIGDLSLTGVDFTAHIIAICSGHRTNVALGKELMNHFSSYLHILRGELNEQCCTR